MVYAIGIKGSGKRGIKKSAASPHLIYALRGKLQRLEWIGLNGTRACGAYCLTGGPARSRGRGIKRERSERLYAAKAPWPYKPGFLSMSAHSSKSLALRHLEGRWESNGSSFSGDKHARPGARNCRHVFYSVKFGVMQCAAPDLYCHQIGWKGRG